MNKTNISRKKRDGIFWGIVLLGGAALLILQDIGVGFGYGITVWRIIAGIFCLAWFIDKLFTLEFAHTIFPLAFEFLIFEAPIAHAIGHKSNNLINDWIVLLAALLATIGLGILLPSKKQKVNGHEVLPGNSTLYFDAADLSTAAIHDNLGNVNAYITNRDAYTGNGVIHIKDNLGKIKLHLPQEWNIILESHDNLGSVSAPEQKDGVYTHSITVNVHDNLGSISIVYS